MFFFKVTFLDLTMVVNQSVHTEELHGCGLASVFPGTGKAMSQHSLRASLGAGIRL